MYILKSVLGGSVISYDFVIHLFFVIIFYFNAFIFMYYLLSYCYSKEQNILWIFIVQSSLEYQVLFGARLEM